MQREIKRENKQNGDIRVVITDATDTFELVVCADTFGRLWDIFGFWYGADGDQDNIPGYREDGLTLEEVEEKISEFISEYGQNKKG